MIRSSPETGKGTCFMDAPLAQIRGVVIKGMAKSATRGKFRAARRKKEDIPLAESDVRLYRPMEYHLFSSLFL